MTTIITTQAADVADIALRLHASEDDVRLALEDREALEKMMRERNISEDVAIFVTIAQRQARAFRDDVIVLPG